MLRKTNIVLSALALCSGLVVFLGSMQPAWPQAKSQEARSGQPTGMMKEQEKKGPGMMECCTEMEGMHQQMRQHMQAMQDRINALKDPAERAELQKPMEAMSKLMDTMQGTCPMRRMRPDSRQGQAPKKKKE